MCKKNDLEYSYYLVTIEDCRLNIEYLRNSFDFKKGRSEATSTNIQFAIFNLQFRLVRVMGLSNIGMTAGGK